MASYTGASGAYLIRPKRMSYIACESLSGVAHVNDTAELAWCEIPQYVPYAPVQGYLDAPLT